MHRILHDIYGLTGKRAFRDAAKLAATLPDDDPRLVFGLQAGTRLIAELGFCWNEVEGGRLRQLEAESKTEQLRLQAALAEARARFENDDAATFWRQFANPKKRGDVFVTDYVFDHVVLAGSKDDINKLVKKFRLPDTLAWKSGDRHFLMFESKGHHTEPFRGQRLVGTASFFSGKNDTSRTLIELFGKGVSWVRQPSKSLAPAAAGLPRLPDELLFSLSGAAGDPDRARAVERLLLD